MIKFRELVAAGAFVQRAGTAHSSFTSINVASAFSVNPGGGVASLGGITVGSAFVGNPSIRGIAIIASGTTVVSIAATGIVSGDVVIATPYNFPVVAGSQGSWNVVVASVSAGRFQIVHTASGGPVQPVPVAWWRVA